MCHPAMCGTSESRIRGCFHLCPEFLGNYTRRYAHYYQGQSLYPDTTTHLLWWIQRSTPLLAVASHCPVLLLVVYTRITRSSRKASRAQNGVSLQLRIHWPARLQLNLKYSPDANKCAKEDPSINRKLVTGDRLIICERENPI